MTKKIPNLEAVLAARAEKRETKIIAAPKATSETLVVPASGVNPLNTSDDWQAFVHQIAPIIVSTLVGINVVTQDSVTLWLPFVFAIADNLLAAGKATDKARRTIYALLLLLQSSSTLTAVVATFVHAPSQVTLVTSIATAAIAVISSFFARFYTQTSTMIPKALLDSNSKE